MSKEPAAQLLQHLPIAIIFPVVLSVILFFMTIFLLVLPTLESALMAQRRGLIHELTETAWSTIHQYYQKQLDGELTKKAAQEQAIAHVRQLRYGLNAKDYFWINDMAPRMIMHPYRPDLEGKDISHYADPGGKRLFVEFVKVVRKSGGGYVDYQWQWMDEPNRIVPKISFVKAFAPWEWVVGTGVYIVDIQNEISAITRKLTLICIGIMALVFLLSVVIVWQGVKVEKERSRAEQRTRLQQEQLYQAGKMATIGTLAAGVAHEINNPVTAILLNAPILRELWQHLVPMDPDSPEVGQAVSDGTADFSGLYARIPHLLNHIEDGAKRIKNIVNELKDFARISPPEMTHDVFINSVVEKAVTLVASLIKASTDHFSVQLAPDLPRLRGNTQKVEQVIVNLLVNACQALPDKSREIRASTGMDAEKRLITVVVADTGIGIPEEVLARIKDPFFTTKQSRGNTGLGLAISDRIMKDHGGDLHIRAIPNEGTMAVLSFPIGDENSSKGDK
ncbi:MAG: cache domain-containing protein [Desulfobacterales bacterium]|jgi:signal transduction histidine kinase|nr:cache domain-containing protein [Desulfobacterales bacterium]